MSIIKAISSRAPIQNALSYVSWKTKTSPGLISGINCSPETVKYEMLSTKAMYGKTGGRTYAHFIQSFPPEEVITPEEAHIMAEELASRAKPWKGHEILISTHTDREHIHSHLVINSVSIEDGHKLQMSKKDLQDIKDLNDRICIAHGKSVCEKNKGEKEEERAEKSIYHRNTYEILQKAEKAQADSYLINIGLAILDSADDPGCRTREDFCRRMEMECGIQVDWTDERKYIVFTDLERKSAGEKKCRARNSTLTRYFNVDFSKEGLEELIRYGFTESIQRKAADAGKYSTGGAREPSQRSGRSAERGSSHAGSDLQSGEEKCTSHGGWSETSGRKPKTKTAAGRGRK